MSGAQWLVRLVGAPAVAMALAGDSRRCSRRAVSSAGLEGDLGGLEQRYRQMKPLWVVLCLIKRMSGTRRKLAKITFRDLSMKRLKNTRHTGPRRLSAETPGGYGPYEAAVACAIAEIFMVGPARFIV